MIYKFSYSTPSLRSTSILTFPDSDISTSSNVATPLATFPSNSSSPTNNLIVSIASAELALPLVTHLTANETLHSTGSATVTFHSAILTSTDPRAASTLPNLVEVNFTLPHLKIYDINAAPSTSTVILASFLSDADNHALAIAKWMAVPYSSKSSSNDAYTTTSRVCLAANSTSLLKEIVNSFLLILYVAFASFPSTLTDTLSRNLEISRRSGAEAPSSEAVSSHSFVKVNPLTTIDESSGAFTLNFATS
ncbi:hypothetical protein J6V86_03365 [bacterium]|nr:hypothetical protein [bacterium]